MRKIVAVFLALATVVVLFTACDGNEPDVTNNTISTGEISTTETTKPEPLTYVLTTNQSKTVPWQETTRFETTAPDFSAIIVPTDPIDVPPVNIVTTGSSLPASVPSDSTTTTMSNPLLSSTSPTASTTKTTTTTTQVEKFPTALIIDSEGYNASNGKLYLGVSPSGWSSDIKAASTSINIRIDGVSVAKKVTCSVTAAKNSDGMQEIVIDLSGQSVSSGSTVTYTIPEGFLVSKSGTQYNKSYTSSATV